GTPEDTFKSLFQTQNASDTAPNGTNQIAYTWELGNGMTFNVGSDERRTKGIGNLSTNVVAVGATPTRRSVPISIRRPGGTSRSTKPGAGWACRGSSTRSTRPTTRRMLMDCIQVVRVARPAPRSVAIRMTSGAGRYCRVSTSRHPGPDPAITSAASSTTESA